VLTCVNLCQNKSSNLPAAKPRGRDDKIVSFTVIRRPVKQKKKKEARKISEKKDALQFRLKQFYEVLIENKLDIFNNEIIHH
jgi:hypothetical protein